jgi:hypothetical protein
MEALYKIVRFKHQTLKSDKEEIAQGRRSPRNKPSFVIWIGSTKKG